MTEGENKLGYVAVDINGDKLTIFEFYLANCDDFQKLDIEADFMLDTLMRSAASWGETKGASYIETSNALYNDFLKKKRFDVDENHAFTQMSTIVHYTNNPQML